MNLFNKTKQICKENNIKPVRSRGQNFLINEDVYDFIVNAAEIKKDDIILEVGPGLGFLTEKLARKVKRVIAVELDDKLANLLKVNLKEKKIDNVEVVNGNILDFRIKNRIKNQESRIKDNNQNYDRSSLDSLFFILNSKYKIVANLPYNITSVFLRKFLSCENKPKSMVLMLQKEVADRIVAGPGKMSLLAVSVQFYAKAEIIKYVPKIDFWPVPKVDSAVIQLRIKNEELHPSSEYKRIKNIDEKKFFQLVRIGFSSKRKMLKNNLAGGYKISQKDAENWLKKAGFNEKIRAQELSVDDWRILFTVCDFGFMIF